MSVHGDQGRQFFGFQEESNGNSWHSPHTGESRQSLTSTELERLRRTAVKTKRENDAFDLHVLRRKVAREYDLNATKGTWDPPVVPVLDTSWMSQGTIEREYVSSPGSYGNAPFSMASESPSHYSTKRTYSFSKSPSSQGKYYSRYSSSLREKLKLEDPLSQHSDDDSDSIAEFRASFVQRFVTANSKTPNEEEKAKREVSETPPEESTKFTLYSKAVGHKADRLSKGNRIEKPNSHFRDAVRRWQVRRRMNESATISEKRKRSNQGAAQQAGIDEFGHFVPRIEEIGVQLGLEDQMMQSQRLILAQMFIRWKKYAIRSQELNVITSDVVRNRKKTLFHNWLLNFKACRGWRFQAMSRALGYLDLHRFVKLSIRKQLVAASAHHREFMVRKALKHWYSTTAKSAHWYQGLSPSERWERKRKLQLAVDKVNTRRTRKWFELWSYRLSESKCQQQAEDLAVAHYRRRCTATALQKWSTLVGRKITNQYSLEMESDELLLSCFTTWKKHTSNSCMDRSRVDAAAVYHEMRLQVLALRQWQVQVKRQSKLHQGTFHWQSRSKRKGLLKWLVFTQESALRRDQFNLAETYRAKSVGKWAFQHFREFLFVLQQEKDADALCDIHRMRRVVSQWKLYVQLCENQQTAEYAWRFRNLTRAIASLKRHVHERVARRHAIQTSEDFRSFTLLRRCWDYWTQFTVQQLALRQGRRIALAFWELRSKRRCFSRWHSVVAHREHLEEQLYARSMSRLASRVLHEWSQVARAWESKRVQLLSNKAVRVLRAWRGQCGVSAMERQGNRVAGVFRRHTLLRTALQEWVSGVQLQQSERKVYAVADEFAAMWSRRRTFNRWKLAMQLSADEPQALDCPERAVQENSRDWGRDGECLVGVGRARGVVGAGLQQHDMSHESVYVQRRKAFEAAQIEAEAAWSSTRKEVRQASPRVAHHLDSKRLETLGTNRNPFMESSAFQGKRQPPPNNDNAGVDALWDQYVRAHLRNPGTQAKPGHATSFTSREVEDERTGGRAVSSRQNNTGSPSRLSTAGNRVLPGKAECSRFSGRSDTDSIGEERRVRQGPLGELSGAIRASHDLRTATKRNARNVSSRSGEAASVKHRNTRNLSSRSGESASVNHRNTRNLSSRSGESASVKHRNASETELAMRRRSLTTSRQMLYSSNHSEQGNIGTNLPTTSRQTRSFSNHSGQGNIGISTRMMSKGRHVSRQRGGSGASRSPSVGARARNSLAKVHDPDREIQVSDSVSAAKRKPSRSHPSSSVSPGRSPKTRVGSDQSARGAPASNYRRSREQTSRRRSTSASVHRTKRIAEPFNEQERRVHQDDSIAFDRLKRTEYYSRRMEALIPKQNKRGTSNLPNQHGSWLSNVYSYAYQ